MTSDSQAHDAAAAASSPLTVLVVDDDHAILDATRTLLEDEGFAVVGAVNGDEALMYLRASPAPCAIVLDLFMPVINGWEFVQEVRKSAKTAGVPIVMITAADPHWGYPVRREYVLRKPFRGEQLVDLLRGVCAGR